MAVHHAELHELVSELDKDIRIAIVTADFNPEITHTLKEKNTNFFHAQWFTHVDHFHVPWAFELPAATTQVTQAWIYHLVITIWCLIKWETPHFDIIANTATQGLIDIGNVCNTPIIFWLLTCNTIEQAQARIDENYAVYWLNYVVQHLMNQNLLEERISEVEQQAQELLQEYTS